MPSPHILVRLSGQMPKSILVEVIFWPNHLPALKLNYSRKDIIDLGLLPGRPSVAPPLSIQPLPSTRLFFSHGAICDCQEEVMRGICRRRWRSSGGANVVRRDGMCVQLAILVIMALSFRA